MQIHVHVSTYWQSSCITLYLHSMIFVSMIKSFWGVLGFENTVLFRQVDCCVLKKIKTNMCTCAHLSQQMLSAFSSDHLHCSMVVSNPDCSYFKFPSLITWSIALDPKHNDMKGLLCIMCLSSWINVVG